MLPAKPEALPVTAVRRSIEVNGVYQVNGHAPGEELAARFNGGILAYRAVTPAT